MRDIARGTSGIGMYLDTYLKPEPEMTKAESILHVKKGYRRLSSPASNPYFIYAGRLDVRITF